jgi:hypothetical protein
LGPSGSAPRKINLDHLIYRYWQTAPKRNMCALALIAEIQQRFDVLAVQEVKRDTRGIRILEEFLGSDWGLIVSDVTEGAAGNTERLAFLFDRRRVRPTGLAGEIVLPPSSAAGATSPPSSLTAPPTSSDSRRARSTSPLDRSHQIRRHRGHSASRARTPRQFHGQGDPEPYHGGRGRRGA